MMSATAILVFALGAAAAEVPHWVQKKPQSSFKMPDVASMIKPILSMHGQQTPNTRRLQAIMSEECKTECPGVMDMITAMMEAQSGERRLDAHEKADPEKEAAMMKIYCDHMDTLQCTAKNKVCQDKEPSEEDAEGMAMLECVCACPKIATIGEDMSKICSDKPGTVGCVSSTPSCAKMSEEMDEGQINLMCEYTSKGCEEIAKGMMECAGQDNMMTWGEKKCEEWDASGFEADVCCPLAKKLIECITVECNTITMAMEKMEADKGSEEAKKSVAGSEAARNACPDAGIPTAAAVSAKASGSSGASADSADFAAPGQAMSMLAMAAVIAASLMA